MTERDGEFETLEDWFAAARDVPPVPSDGLTARVLADAAAVAATRVAATRGKDGQSPHSRGAMWGWILDLLGGRAGLVGLASAVLAGLSIGLLQPAPVAGLVSALETQTASVDPVDLVPSLADYLTEN